MPGRAGAARPPTEPGDEATDDADPLVVAQAIGQKAGEVAYDRVVLGYLSKVARRCRAEERR